MRKVVPALAAELCARGAARVSLFGSLATGAPPHDRTDVDLCVEGMSDRAAALAALELEAAFNIPVRVICWEFASERLRELIRTYGEDVTVPASHRTISHVTE
jgi:predicted nucleotidyltransferase